jgi:hypothetical protein
VGALIATCGGPAYAIDTDFTDLEQRVAELEASAARRGGKKVSLAVYGQVNRAILIWDDGKDSDAYVVDNDTSSTRAGFIGKATVRDGWSAGYRIELEFKDSASDDVFNGNDEGAGDNDIRTRQANWYIDSKTLGRITLGQQSPATDDITIISLGASMSDAGLHYNNNFGLRLKSSVQLQNGLLFPAGTLTNLKWSTLAHTVDTFRGDFLRYDTPILNGFLLSGAWGENDIWDAALRHQFEWNGVRVASGVGYMDNGELKFSDVRGSVSAIHEYTGLFLTAAGGVRDDNVVTFAIAELGEFEIDEDSYFYFGQLGVSKQWFPAGKTTIYGEYGHYNNFGVGAILRDAIKTGIPEIGISLDNEIERLGFGVEQTIDASALLLYANFNYYKAEVSYCEFPWRRCAAGLAGTAKSKELPTQDWTGVVLGARIQF